MKEGKGTAPVTAKKAYGQNFIINPGICPKMVEGSGIDETFGVLEIGPGLGALTVEIAKRAKKVVAIEIDGSLIPRLKENLYGYDNVEIIQGDVMKLDIKKILAESFEGMKVAVMGNLPYYITSPILMRLLEERLPVESITAMVQKEAAQRLCARPGSRESGAVTLAVRYYSEPCILFDVSPGSFYPKPKVMSSVIRLDVRKTPAVAVQNEQLMFAVIKAAFAQRRKTAANAVSAGMHLPKEAVLAALAQCELAADIRPERLTLENFAQLSDLLDGHEH